MYINIYLLINIYLNFDFYLIFLKLFIFILIIQLFVKHIFFNNYLVILKTILLNYELIYQHACPWIV